MLMLKTKKKHLMVSLPLLSLFVCIFPYCTENCFGNNKQIQWSNNLANGSMRSDVICQNNEQTDEESNSAEQKLRAKAARDTQINSLLEQAIDLYKQKQLLEAIDLFGQVVRLDPENASAHFSLGIALEANKDLTGAEYHYKTAYDLEPGNNEYQRAALKSKKKLEERNHIQFEESKKQLLASQAAEAFKQGQYDQALSLYQELEKQQPRLAFAKYNIGTIYLIQKKADDALSYYKEAYKLEPSNKQYEESLQKLKLSIKQVEESEKAAKAPASANKETKQKNSKNKSSKQSYLAFCGLRVKSNKAGVLIEAILTGSRAAQAGLRPGDIIQVIDGRAIKKEAQLEEVLKSKTYGQKFQLLVLRGNQTGQILF